MQISVRGHNLEVTPPLRDYAIKKIEKMEQFLKGIIRAEAELEFRDVRDASKTQVCKVTMWVRDTSLRAEAQSADMYASIDAVFDNLENQVKKYKAKHRIEGRRHAHEIKTDLALEAGLPLYKEKERLIIPMEHFAPKPMTEEEAKEELRIMDKQFIVFSNRTTKNVNVAVKGDGDFQIIGPENTKVEELSPEVASEALSKSDSSFLMFRNPQTSSLNVLYKRSSGNFGLIEPRA